MKKEHFFALLVCLAFSFSIFVIAEGSASSEFDLIKDDSQRITHLKVAGCKQHLNRNCSSGIQLNCNTDGVSSCTAEECSNCMGEGD